MEISAIFLLQPTLRSLFVELMPQDDGANQRRRPGQHDVILYAENMKLARVLLVVEDGKSLRLVRLCPSGH